MHDKVMPEPPRPATDQPETARSDAAKHDAAARQSPSKATPTVLERVLARGEPQSVREVPAVEDARGGATQGDLREADVASWNGESGTLADGSSVGLGASCLLRPQAGDRVLVWCPLGRPGRVLAVLERPDGQATAVLTTSGPLAIEAPQVAVASQTVQIRCDDLLTHSRNHHSVEDTRTDSARIRVAQIGVDIRRATTSSEEVSGTMIQKVGTWISSTARDARLKARTFLFD